MSFIRHLYNKWVIIPQIKRGLAFHREKRKYWFDLYDFYVLESNHTQSFASLKSAEYHEEEIIKLEVRLSKLV